MKTFIICFITVIIPAFFVLLAPSTMSRSLAPEIEMNTVAEQYVKLVLAIGQHDGDYVDAYHGPKEWQEEAEKDKKPLPLLKDWADKIQSDLAGVRIPATDEALKQRKTFLRKQLKAAQTRIEMVAGTQYSFDEEAKRLYDAVPPRFSEKHFSEILAELTKLLPAGSGALGERYARFRNQFIIPKAKLDSVFTAAIHECRARTKEFIALPPNESFAVEYVRDKAWSGYNWYKGNAHSVIQVNTDIPIFINRAVDLAAHEGYPGHHVYNALLEMNLLKKKGWIEFSIYPLFSPQSLIAEGSANYGIHIVFSDKERMEFEKTVLFPLAGLDSRNADRYYKVQNLTAELSYAGNEAARAYLNGTISKEQTIKWLSTYALLERAQAEQRIRFIEKYRSYVINYNLGQDLVRQYVEEKAGKNAVSKKRWEVFGNLLSSPLLPSGLK